MSVGAVVTFVQFAEGKSELSCNTKLVEGTSQEMPRLPPEALMLNCGDGWGGGGGMGNCSV